MEREAEEERDAAKTSRNGNPALSSYSLPILLPLSLSVLPSCISPFSSVPLSLLISIRPLIIVHRICFNQHAPRLPATFPPIRFLCLVSLSHAPPPPKQLIDSWSNYLYSCVLLTCSGNSFSLFSSHLNPCATSSNLAVP